MKSTKYLVTLLICSGALILGMLTNAEAQTQTASTASAKIVGKWQGTLVAPGTRLPLVLNVKESQTGQLSGAIDLPDQGVNGIPAEHFSYADRIMSFDLDIGAPSSYEAAVSSDFVEFDGSFEQSGVAIPLVLTRADAKPDDKTAKPGSPPKTASKLDLQPCGQPKVPRDALCGQYEVFEDRTKNAGRKIKLNVLVLPALIEKPAPDPIFYLVGGPGGAATGSASLQFMIRLRRTRDVVMVDQRGTGKSNALQCNYRGDATDMRGSFQQGLTVEAAKACRSELEKVADLRLYTTTIAMADLDDVRAALGYDKINVYGGSYGATTSLSYLNLYPQHVRTVTVSGVAPPDSPLPLSYARSVEHALNRLFDDCAADEKCHAAFPNLRQDWATTVANVTKGPVTFDTLNPITRQKQEITMSLEGFRELVRLVLYIPNLMSITPLLIHQMSQGDYTQFAFYAFQVQSQLDATLSRGMQLSVLCAEDIPFLKDADIESQMGGTFYGSGRAHLYRKVCQEWPRGEVPAKYRQPIKSDVPVLMLSGELDPVTPPDLATPLLKGFPNGRQILMHNATHNTYPCAEKLARDFIESGSAKGLDASCVDQIKRQPWITSLPPLPVPK